jgi:hypothetical protein
MGNLNALLAFQLAHIILDHRLDTKYAFNDRLLFPSTSVFEAHPHAPHRCRQPKPPRRQSSC